MATSRADSKKVMFLPSERHPTTASATEWQAVYRKPDPPALVFAGQLALLRGTLLTR